MRVCLLLLSCSAALLLASVARGTGEEEASINPFELAKQLRAEICATNKSQVQEFYKAQRDRENRDRQVPSATELTFGQRQPKVSWLVGKVTKILQPYLGKRLSNVTLDLFTWCIFPLSTMSDIYGCINSTDRWGSPGFKALGLLDIMSLTNSSGKAYKRGHLVIDTSKNAHLSVLKGALVSCTIRLPDDSTIGVYWHLDLVLNVRGSTFDRISPGQTEAFLVDGQQKNFTCKSVGDEVTPYGWYQRTKSGQYNWICEDNQDKVAETCSNASSYQLIFREAETPGCEFALEQGFRYHHIDNVLVFVSPTVNDTGEVLCNSSSPTNDPGRSIYIAVELPPEKIEFNKSSSSLLTCEMKAPSDSVVYWTQKQVEMEECQIPNLNKATPNDTSIALCDTIAVVNNTVIEIDKEYSIFHSELQISEVSFDHLGMYFCNVKYKVSSLVETQLIRQHSSIFIVDQDAVVGMGGLGVLSKSQITMAVIGSFIFCFLAGASVTVSLVLWVRNAERRKSRKRIARLSKGRFSIKYNEVELLSPGAIKFQQFEFPRSNLELQDIIGEGRFGKVYKGKAYGIVPDAVNLNTVAVKTTATDQLHSCTQQLLSELEILTRIQPHENICNLLASCTSPDGPLYVIMEYACHGNLRDYLEMCRETLLQRSIPVHMVSEEERSYLWQMLISCDREDSETNSPSETAEVINFIVPSPPSCDPESKFGYDHLSPAGQDSPCMIEGEKAMMWSTGYDRLLSAEDSNCDSELDDIICGNAASNCLITELNVCDFARQIASGLQHLEEMSIVHCDLAARNILIAEGFLLKIGDFGMAKCMASDARYQRIQSNEESMIAIKWAALEVLEKEIYSFKSDIWSFATVIWEIATYGSKPFGDLAIGASMEPFIQYLKNGNRLPQPDGLSDSIYTELCSCWSADPNIRPSASSLVDCFQMQKESRLKESSGPLGEQDESNKQQ